MGNCCIKEESNLQTLYPFTIKTDKLKDYNRKEYLEYKSKSNNHFKSVKTYSPFKNPIQIETTENDIAKEEIVNETIDEEKTERKEINENVLILESLEEFDKLGGKYKEKIIFESKSSKFITHLRLKIKKKKRICSEILLNKESFVNENSNHLSDDYSLIQEKDKFSQDDSNIKKEEQSMTILNNYDLTNLVLDNSRIYLKKNISNCNLTDINKQNNENEIANKNENDYVVETSFKSENTSKKASVNSKKKHNKNDPITKCQKNSKSTLSSNQSKMIRNMANPIIFKKMNLIPQNSEVNKNTISSENTNLSSQRRETNDISNNVAKFKQFELLLKSTTNLNGSKRHKEQAKNLSVNSTIITAFSIKNRINMNKYGYLFSDVNPKPKNSERMSFSEPISNYNTNETQIFTTGLKGTLVAKHQ